MIASPHWQGKSDYAEKLLVFFFIYTPTCSHKQGTLVETQDWRLLLNSWEIGPLHYHRLAVTSTC